MPKLLKTTDTPDPQKRLTGNRLRQARQAKRWRLKDLAKILDCGVATLGGYENAVRSPPVSMVLRLGEALDVSAAWLLGVEHTLGFSEEEIEMLMRYRSASAEERQMALHVLNRRRSSAA